MPPPAAADVAVDQFVELEAFAELVVLLVAAGVLELLLGLLPQAAASRMLPTAAVIAAVLLIARKVSLPCQPAGGRRLSSWLDKFHVGQGC
jgi:hypothetical protein